MDCNVHSVSDLNIHIKLVFMFFTSQKGLCNIMIIVLSIFIISFVIDIFCFAFFTNVWWSSFNNSSRT